MNPSPRLNPAFRKRAFVASVFEGVWPGATVSRVNRNLLRHGKRVSYGPHTDAWQRKLWGPDERPQPVILPEDNDLPF